MSGDLDWSRQRINDLERQVADLAQQVADLERQNHDLRDAVDALLRPAPSELLPKNIAHPSRRKV